MSARVLARGSNNVLQMAGRLMPIMEPVTGSTSIGASYNIPVGTVDQRQGYVILGRSSYEVFYIRENGNLLEALPTNQFLQGYMIGQVAGEVYRRTQWIIPASKIAMAFGMGMVIGFVGAVAVAANIIVLLGRFLVFVDSHPNEMRIVRQHLPQVFRDLSWFRSNCPILYSKLSAVLGAGVRQALLDSPSGITAEDVASVLGRLLGGLAGAPETGFRVLAGIFVRTLTVYTALHLPLMVGHGVAQHPAELSRALSDEIRRQSISVTPVEQEQIRQELARSPQALQTLQSLNGALTELAPALDRLAADFQRP